MSQRGRGNGPVKRGMPNLNLAGKRENQAGSGAKTGKDGKDKRSSRGRGRGRGRGDKVAFIQTEGIFSEGLHSAPAVKREVDTDYLAAIRGTRNGTVKKDKQQDETMETEETEKTDGFVGWDQEWEESADEEIEALNEVLGGTDFITDYKQGDRLPIVLPEKDEAQFHKIITKHARYDLKEKVKPEKYDLEGVSNPTDFLSRKAGESLLKAFEDSSDNTLVLLQLPSAVNVLAAASSSKTIKTEKDIDNQVSQPSPNISSIPELPKGRKIGKLQITKSGKTLLRIGDTVLTISEAAPTEIHEDAILLETKPDPSPMYHTGIADSGKNAVYHIGEVKHRYVASVDWGDLRKKHENKTAKDETPVDKKSNPSGGK